MKIASTLFFLMLSFVSFSQTGTECRETVYTYDKIEIYTLPFSRIIPGSFWYGTEPDKVITSGFPREIREILCLGEPGVFQISDRTLVMDTVYHNMHSIIFRIRKADDHNYSLIELMHDGNLILRFREDESAKSTYIKLITR